MGTFTSISTKSEKEVLRTELIDRDKSYAEKKFVIDLSNKDKTIN